MEFGGSVRRGGKYSRLAEPAWDDPLDTSFSRNHGGRWNEPGSFGVLYLNASDRMARLQAEHKLRGQPYGIDDLDPDELHDLVRVDVAECEVLDIVTDDGLRSVGLPASYPDDGDGARVPHAACRPLGMRAHRGGLAGIACRSAARGARPADEELALFDRVVADLVTQTARVPFREWYLGEAG